MKILIPNATGPTNTGDQAILRGQIDLINSSFDRPSISIHSSESSLYTKIQKLGNPDPTLYSWIAFESKSSLTKFVRLAEYTIDLFLLRLGLQSLLIPNTRTRKLIKDYEQADLIVFVGGGYLRSKKGITQSINLLMLLTHIWLPKLLNKKAIMGPVSIGPFVYSWQEKLTCDVLKDLGRVFVRESFSMDLTKRNGLNNVSFMIDSALFLNVPKTNNLRNRSIGFTIRNWLNGFGQDNLESTLTETLYKFCKKNKLSVQPIVQTMGIKYGDKDVEITGRIANELTARGIKVNKPIHLSDATEAIKAYSKVDTLIGMRMHSNILSGLQGTPFLPISYEYKTDGISKQLGVSKYLIKCEEVTTTNLGKNLTEIYKKRKAISKLLLSRVKSLQSSSLLEWKKHIN